MLQEDESVALLELCHKEEQTHAAGQCGQICSCILRSMVNSQPGLRVEYQNGL